MNAQTESLTGNKAKLVESAVELMASKGFGNAGVNEILEHAGVSKGNFYYHFESKQALGLMAIDHMANGFIESVLRSTLKDTSQSPKVRFEKLFDCYIKIMIDRCCQRGCPFINLAMETSDSYPKFQQRLAQFFTSYQKLIRKTVQEGIDAGDFKPELDAQIIGGLVHAQLIGAMVLSKALKSPEPLERSKITLLALLCKTN